MNPSLPTPVHIFPPESDLNGLVIKREDQSVSGSHKFRYLKPKLEKLAQEGIKAVVLSTTGNAGITASHFGAELGIKVICLMSDRGDMSKAAQIEAEGGILIVTPRPVRFAKYIAKKYDIPLLRASRDEDAVEHYRSLGEEIQEQVPDVQAVVNFCTSGTSSVGLMSAFEAKPALHLVQSGKSCSVVKALHPEQVPGDVEEGVGLADTARKEELLKLIEVSGGDAHYVPRETGKIQIPDSKFSSSPSAGLRAEGQIPETSWEGICSLRVALKLLSQYEKVVVIFSGKKWPQVDFQPSHTAATFDEIDQLYSSLIETNA